MITTGRFSILGREVGSEGSLAAAINAVDGHDPTPGPGGVEKVVCQCTQKRVHRVIFSGAQPECRVRILYRDIWTHRASMVRFRRGASISRDDEVQLDIEYPVEAVSVLWSCRRVLSGPLTHWWSYTALLATGQSMCGRSPRSMDCLSRI